jgi:hypothetical protein
MNLIFKEEMFPKNIYVFHSLENISCIFHQSEQDLDYMIPKGISQAKSQIYIVEKEITNSREIFAVLILKYQSPPQHYNCYFIIPFEYKFVLAAECI